MCPGPTVRPVDRETATLYTALTGAVEAALGAAEALVDALDRRTPTRPLHLLAYASAVSIRDVLSELADLLERRRELFDDGSVPPSATDN